MRDVIECLVRDGTAVARSDDSIHELYLVAAYAAEVLRKWVLREGATQTIETGYGISALRACEGLLGDTDLLGAFIDGTAEQHGMA